MSNRSYVCIKCRTSRRAGASGGLKTSLRCSLCSGPLWELEWRWRIPKKDDDKGWKELSDKVAVDSSKWLPHRRQIGEHRLQEIDKAIQALEKRKPTATTTDEVRKLRNQRTKIVARYYELASTKP